MNDFERELQFKLNCNVMRGNRIQEVCSVNTANKLYVFPTGQYQRKDAPVSFYLRMVLLDYFFRFR